MNDSSDARSHPPGPARPVAALAVTLCAAVVVVLASLLPLPGYRSGWAFGPRVPWRAVGSVLSLGLSPIIAGFVAVELAALVVPAWRRWRIGGPGGRRRLGRIALWLSFAFASFQALGVVIYLPTVGRLPHGLVPALTAGTALVAGTFFLLAVAALVSRFGLGDGISVILATDIAVEALGTFGRVTTSYVAGLVSTRALLLGVELLAVVVIGTLWTLSSRHSRTPGDGEPPIVIPRLAPGVLPLGDGAALVAMLAPLAVLMPVLGSLAHRLRPEGRSGQLVVLGFIVLLGIVLGALFNRPSKVAEVFMRCRGLTEGHEGYRRIAGRRLMTSLLHGIVYLLLVQVVYDFAIARSSPFVPLGLIPIVVLTAVAGDLVGEWRFRARHGPVVSIWPVHRVYAVTPLIEALDAAGIPCHPRGRWHRTLLQFFGPYIPVGLLVTETDSGGARQVLDAILVSSDPGHAFARTG